MMGRLRRSWYVGRMTLYLWAVLVVVVEVEVGGGGVMSEVVAAARGKQHALLSRPGRCRIAHGFASF